MLKLATASLSWAQIEDYELKKAPPSYTSETVLHFKEKHPPQTQHFLIIGYDQWEALPRWKDPEILTRNVEFIVVGRDHTVVARLCENLHPRKRTLFRNSIACFLPFIRVNSSREPSYFHEKIPYSVSFTLYASSCSGKCFA